MRKDKPKYGYFVVKTYLALFTATLTLGTVFTTVGRRIDNKSLLYTGLIVLVYGVLQAVGHILGLYIIPEKRSERARRIAKLTGLSGTERVLDIGAGRGVIAIEFARHLTTGKVTAIDIWHRDSVCSVKRYDFTSPPFNHSIQRTTRNAEIEGVRSKISFATMDANNLAFAPKAFSVVTCAYIMLHLHGGGLRRNDLPRLNFLKQVYAVLKPGGSIVVFDLVYSSFTEFLSLTPMIYIGAALFSKWISEDYWIQLLKKSGFQIEHAEIKRGNIVLIARKPGSSKEI